MGRGVSFLDCDIEQRGIAGAGDDTAPDPVRVREENLAVQHGAAEQQRRGDRRVKRLLPAKLSTDSPPKLTSTSPPKLRAGKSSAAESASGTADS